MTLFPHFHLGHSGRNSIFRPTHPRAGSSPGTRNASGALLHNNFLAHPLEVVQAPERNSSGGLLKKSPSRDASPERRTRLNPPPGSLKNLPPEPTPRGTYAGLEVDPPSYIYIYIYVCIHIYIYIYMYMHALICACIIIRLRYMYPCTHS